MPSHGFLSKSPCAQGAHQCHMQVVSGGFFSFMFGRSRCRPECAVIGLKALHRAHAGQITSSTSSVRSHPRVPLLDKQRRAGVPPR
jgi:hypothetical protein